MIIIIITIIIIIIIIIMKDFYSAFSFSSWRFTTLCGGLRSDSIEEFRFFFFKLYNMS